MVIATTAQAQTISFGDALDHQDGEAIGDQLVLFTTYDTGVMPFRAVFDGKFVTTDNVADAKEVHNFTLDERGQQLTFKGPQFGARWRLTPELSLKGSVGVSWLKLKQEAVNVTTSRIDAGQFQSFFDEFSDFQSTPGFSASVGGDYVLYKFKHLNIKAGMQMTYMSSFDQSGHDADGDGTITVGTTDTTYKYAESRTTDIALNLLHLQPSVGLEWRPFQSFLVNSFGLYFSYVQSFSSLTKEFSDVDQEGGVTSVDETMSADVSVGLRTKQFLGAYYGWYLGIPHFGNLGIELQFGSHTSGSLSYQYYF